MFKEPRARPRRVEPTLIPETSVFELEALIHKQAVTCTYRVAELFANCIRVRKIKYDSGKILILCSISQFSLWSTDIRQSKRK